MAKAKIVDGVNLFTTNIPSSLEKFANLKSFAAGDKGTDDTLVVDFTSLGGK